MTLSDPLSSGTIEPGRGMVRLGGNGDATGHLLQVAVDLSSGLDLRATMQRIVEAAVTMTGARAGAMGIWDPDEMVAAVGDAPAGGPRCELLRDRPGPLRIADLTGDGGRGSFLGVPIAIRGRAIGGLCVTDDRVDHFTASDEDTARALASIAAVAIEAARWTSASREITAAVLSESDPHVRPLHLIASLAGQLADAEQVIVLVPPDPEEDSDAVDNLVISAAAGRYAEEVLGQHIPVEESTTGAVFRTGEPVITERFRRPIQAFTDLGERPAVVVPLRSEEQTLGVIAVARDAAAPRFDDGDLALVQDFANHASIALTIARARRASTELAMLADRERIAGDLHDQVIQRVFAVGMDLQGMIARVRSPELAGRLTRSVDELQAVINDIRATIFDLGHPRDAHGGFAKRIQDAVARLTEDRDITATLTMSGPMSVVPAALADHAEAVVVEALSNAVRHSGARAVTVEVAVGDDLRVEVADNGRGIPADNQRRSGLANLARRARDAGGDLAITSPPGGGTCLSWSVPLPDF